MIIYAQSDSQPCTAVISSQIVLTADGTSLYVISYTSPAAPSDPDPFAA